MRRSLNQILLRVIFLTIALIGCLQSFGVFSGSFNRNWYVYYTHLSNYACVILMFILVIRNIRQFCNGQTEIEDSPKHARIQFFCVIAILVTCLVANVLLDKSYLPAYWMNLNLKTVIMHLVAPIMFIVDWFLHTKHASLKWYDPLLCTVLPLVYVGMILLRAPFLPSGEENLIRYPYFFLNVDSLGYKGVAIWVAILLVIFIALGYLFYFLDRLHLKQSKK